MAISKLILNGDVQMDVTGTTAIESDVRTGKKFTKVNGVEATGTDPGASLQSSKTATPSTSQQTILPDSGYDGLEQVVVNAMPTGRATTTATTITANPSFSLDSSTGVVTASVSASKTVTPTIQAGYISVGTAGTISAIGSNTLQLTSLSAHTYTPGTTSQTIPAGRYLTGAQTISPIPSQYIIPSGTSNITSNGTYDVTNYASANVSVANTYSGYSIYDLAQPYAWYPGSLYDENVTQITNFAFAARSGVSYAEFPNCTEIFTSAFYSCVNLSGISFSACTSVASYAFANCSKLANINMPNVTRISGHAFEACKSLVSVNLPSCEYMSNDNTFAWCSKLKTVSLPHVSEVGQYAFYQCSVLENVYLPQCTIIYNSAFVGCTALSYINLPNCTIMRASVFAGCSNLETISAPNLLGTMSNTFESCIKLKSVYFPASGMTGTAFGMYAFRSCYALESVDIPYVEIIASYLFQYCSALSYVSLPNCSTVYVYAFANTGLPSIYLPECLLIGAGAFASNYNLTRCSFPKVSRIITSAFLNCYSLSTVIIGTSFSASATGVYISGNAFGSCYHLLSLYILSGEYQLATTAFVNTPISNNTTSTGGIYGSIFMPSSLYNIYYNKAVWSVYRDRMVSLTDAQIQNVLSYGRHDP